MSACHTVANLISVWDKAALPVARSYDVVKCLLKVDSEWKSIQKSTKCRTRQQISKERNFEIKLGTSFDVAHHVVDMTVQLVLHRLYFLTFCSQH
jgi:hypothetical protein